MREERYLEWSAEVHAILDDMSVRAGVIRAVRAFRFSAGIWRAAGHLRPPLRHANLATRIVTCVIAWFAVVPALVGLSHVFPDRHGWPFILIMMLLCAFAAGCLADIVRAEEVRYLPKWAWALICVSTIPTGAIAYLSIGRIGNPHQAPPGAARP
jgi:hypothetical protein